MEYSKEQYQKFKKLESEGKTTKEISRLIGVHYETLRCWMRGNKPRCLSEKARTATLKNLKLAMKSNKKRYHKKITIPSLSKSEDFSYLLGVFFGDGSTNNGRFALKAKDRSFVLRTADCIGRLFKEPVDIKTTEQDGKTYYYIYFCSKKMTDYLETKTQDKTIIPRPVFSAPEAIKVAFLAGFFDSECSVSLHYNVPVIRLTQKNKKILLQVKKILESLGIESTLISVKNRKKGVTYFELAITSSSASMFYSKVELFEKKQHLLRSAIKSQQNLNKYGKKISRLALLNNARTGKNVTIWHYANLFGCEIGENTTIGSFCEIGKEVRVGKNCKIEAYSFIPTGVTIENNVLIGPNVVFTNDIFPRAITTSGELKYNQEWTIEKTVVKEGASVGANTTIVPGITIGQYSMVGAGSVVTKDVEPHALVYGNPARARGYVCKCGKKLGQKKPETPLCESCAKWALHKTNCTS